MPFVKVREADYSLPTGLTPTWLYYGKYDGTARPVSEQPQWREYKTFFNTGVYGFTPWKQDIDEGIVWFADMGEDMIPRYVCGTTTPGHKALCRIEADEPSNDATLPLLTFTSFLDNTYAPGASVSIVKVPAVDGLFLAVATTAFANLIKTKAAVTVASLSYDDAYDSWMLPWGYDPLLTTAEVDLTVLDQYAQWPAGLPQEPFADGAPTYETRDNVLRTESDTGPHQMRRRTSVVVEDFQFSMVLSPAQMALLKTFYYGTLRQTQLFTWKDFRTMLPGNYRFVKPPSGGEYFASEENKDSPHWWRVSFHLELITEA